MKVDIQNLCTEDGLKDFSLVLDLSGVTVLYDSQEVTSTSILYALVGLGKILDGRILIDQIPLEEYPQPLVKSFGYVFDEGIMLANLSLLENLMLPLRWLNPEQIEAETIALIHSWMGTFGLKMDLSQRPSAYRPGALKLLSYIRTLMISPKVLVLDDPYYILNKTERTVLFEVLSRLRTGYPMLIASTDDDFFTGFADRVIDLNSRVK